HAAPEDQARGSKLYLESAAPLVSSALLAWSRDQLQPFPRSPSVLPDILLEQLSLLLAYGPSQQDIRCYPSLEAGYTYSLPPCISHLLGRRYFRIYEHRRSMEYAL